MVECTQCNTPKWDALPTPKNQVSMLNAMQDGVYVINQQYEIEYINPALQLGFGLVEGRKCYQYFHNYEEPCSVCPNALVFSGKTIGYEWYSSKNHKTYDMIATPLKNANGSISKLGIFRDITSRKKTEKSLRESYEQLRNFSAHLHSVREEERTRIAHEIHDELGQSLTALQMDLSWLGKRLPKYKESLLKKVGEMSELIDSTILAVQRISTELRPPILNDLGLMAAIKWQAGEFTERTGVKCEISPGSKYIAIGQRHDTAIFRIFQEALTNVNRHAEATKVKVSLREKAGKLEFQIRDDGIGIKKEQIIDPKSLGLIGIRERARYLGGETTISGIQGKGTTITVTLPINGKRETQ